MASGTGFVLDGGGGSKIAIRESLRQNCGGHVVVQLEPIGLAVFLVPAQIEPAEPIEDGVKRDLCIAFDIGVVDAQNHGSPEAPGEEPVENEGPGAADVKISGGRRSKADTQHGLLSG